MTTDSVLRTVQSLLDNKPYLHEPKQKDHPGFNEFVRFTTWRWLLLDYLEHETHPRAKAWLRCHIANNADKMTAELSRQQATNGPWIGRLARKSFNSAPYPPRKEYPADYSVLHRDLQTAIQACKSTQPALSSTSAILGATPPLTDAESGNPAIHRAKDSNTRTQLKRKPTMKDDKTRPSQAQGPPTLQSKRPSKRTKKDVEVIDLT